MSLAGKYKHVTAILNGTAEAAAVVVNHWLSPGFQRYRQEGAHHIEVNGPACLTTYDVPIANMRTPSHVILEAVAADMEVSRGKHDVHPHQWCPTACGQAGDTREIAEWTGDVVSPDLDQWAFASL